jgi:hypothetical protein
VIGSKDETGGCQGCVAVIGDSATVSLRLRLPNALGKYVLIEDVHFAYGQEVLVAARHFSSSGRGEG